METKTKILIVEHDKSDIDFLQRELKKANVDYMAEIVETKTDYENALQSFKSDIILSDYNLPSFSGVVAFEIKEKIAPRTPFIFVSGAIGEENAIELINSGVTDYVLKDKLFSLPVKIERALKEVDEIRGKHDAEEMLIQSETNLRAIFENTDTGFLLLDKKFTIISFNKQANHFARLSFGFDLEKNRNFVSMFAAERQQEFSGLFGEITKGNNINYETNYPQTDGTIIWYHINGNPVSDINGMVTRICLAVNDITEKKKAEENLIQKNAELNKINSELDHFVYSISHDLRGPIASILGLLNIANKDKETDKQEHGIILHRIEKTTERLQRFIHNLMVYSRNTKMEFVSIVIDWEKLIKECWHELKPLAYENGIEFSYEIKGDGNFYGDEERIAMLLRTFLQNAIQFHHEEEREKTVHLFVHFDAASASMQIKDNGIGIAKEHQQKIFEMFFRGTARSRGSGLGLYIANEIVSKINGKILLDSIPGKGSVFSIQMPSLESNLN